jgi:ABC-type sugar transport system, periplasmic component
MKNNKIVTWALVTVLILAFAFAGISCKAANTTAAATTTAAAETIAAETTAAAVTTATETPVAEKKLVFGFTNPSTDAWYTNNAKGFKDYCDANGIEAQIMQTQKPQDALEQVDHIDQMITKKVDAIGVSVSDANVLVDSVKKANAAKIPIGTNGAEINLPIFGANDVDVRVVGSNYEPAKKLGLYIATLLGGKGNVAVVSGIPGIGVSEDRNKGIIDGCKEGGLTVLDSQPGNWDSEKTYNVMADYLTKFNKIDAVFGGYDDGALACYQAAKAVGREKEMKFFGFDGTKPVFDSIAKGEISGDVDMNSYNMGYLMAFGLHRAAVYKNYQRFVLQVEFRIVTSDNLALLYPEYAK